MGQVSFTPTFSGGNGNLTITSITYGQVLNFTQADSGNAQVMNLPAGNEVISITGGAPSGSGGNIALVITGDVLPASTTQNFASGFIPPHMTMLFVTV